MRQAVVLLVLILSATLAQAEDLPKRKSGLWQVKSVAGEGNPHTLQMCVDERTDHALKQIAEGRFRENCTVDKVRRDGDKLVIDAACTLATHQGTAKTHAIVTGKFDSEYRIESTSNFDAPVHGKTETNAVIEGRWTGPCQPGQRPGDAIFENGTKVNLNAEAQTEAKRRQPHSKRTEPAGSKGRSGKDAAPANQPSSPQ
jgi:hypothetical protein